MKDLIIVANENIDDDLFEKVMGFDKTIFPLEDEYALPSDVFRKLYEDNKEGLFVLLNKAREVVGYVNCIFPSDAQRDKYLVDKKYLSLKNIGFKVGDNNLYLYTVALAEEYRNSIANLVLARAFAKWLYEERKKEKKIKFCFTEAVTKNGTKVAQFMGMIPYDEKSIDFEGKGIYVSPDCLDEHINKMLRLNKKY